ncbi:MAG: helix-turn-helix transcriptional regulator [Acidimicrobiales bacterium]|nr:helix-turn-helix domain-containing protein [Actinomycetota bacterium]
MTNPPPPSEPLPSEPVELAPSETAGSTVGLESIPPGRRAVLSTLKTRGEASAEEIAGVLGVTVGAVRQHLGPLEREGLVAHRDERPGPGRPRRRYCLTPATESLWPKRYGQLTNQLLSFIEDADASLVDLAFERRRQSRVERARTRMEGLAFPDRVKELANILDEDGYLASCEQADDGRWHVVEHNCAILDVAQKYGAACRSELSFLQETLPDADVRRTAHMMAGAHVCAYEITERAAEG